MTPAPRSTDAPAALTAQCIPAQGDSPAALDSMERSAWQKRADEAMHPYAPEQHLEERQNG